MCNIREISLVKIKKSQLRRLSSLSLVLGFAQITSPFEMSWKMILNLALNLLSLVNSRSLYLAIRGTPVMLSSHSLKKH